MRIRSLGFIVSILLALALASCSSSVEEQASLVWGTSKVADTKSIGKKEAVPEKAKKGVAVDTKGTAKKSKEELQQFAKTKAEAKEKADKAELARKQELAKQAEIEAAKKAKANALAEKEQAKRAEKEAAKKALEEKEKAKAAEALAARKARADALAEKEKAKAAEALAIRKARADALAEKEKARLARAEALVESERVKAQEKEAKRLAKQKSEAERATQEVDALASQRRGKSLFSIFSVGAPAHQHDNDGYDIFVDYALLETLSPANAKIEISLSEQRARVFQRAGGENRLVVDTPVSTGKSGHETPTGTFPISEKLVDKQSSLYGQWLNSAGEPIPNYYDVRKRPAGGARFVGADMPYWMRLTGGIGMHVGMVPEYPASHGCIRVPSSIQPLIFSKVGLGTQVRITQ